MAKGTLTVGGKTTAKIGTGARKKAGVQRTKNVGLKAKAARVTGRLTKKVTGTK